MFSKALYGTATEVIFNTVKGFEEDSAFVDWLTLMYQFLAYGNEVSDGEGEGDMDADEFEDGEE